MKTPNTQHLRLSYIPQVPSSLLGHTAICALDTSNPCQPIIKRNFPSIANLPSIKIAQGVSPHKATKIGVFFSGGPAPGGHNVIWGISKKIEQYGGSLLGFLGGAKGLLEGNFRNISPQDLDSYKNTGGFDLLGTGRTKIASPEQMQQSLLVCNKLDLDGLIVIGGDDSNTNAAILANYFHENKCKTCVIGVPKTIDADLRSKDLPLSFGFDTACRVYAEMIGNICKDALSSQKYTHFIKLMGRSASHIALECALATCPNLTLIGEEVFHLQQTLPSIVEQIATLITARKAAGKSYGVILIPEGLIQFMPEVSLLLEELNKISASAPKGEFSPDEVLLYLSDESKACFAFFPEKIQEQLLASRDPHGNVQLSAIQTETLLATLVGQELQRRNQDQSYHPITHFLGYEGRCAFPSNFDANYTYALGLTAACLIQNGLSGYIASISNLEKDPKYWQAGGIPLASLMQMEMRKGKEVPVISKTLVDCNSPSFHYFSQMRQAWALGDHYRSPGPMQFSQVIAPISLQLDQGAQA